MTSIDFSKALADAKSASFEAMPKGDYNIEVASAEAVTASTGRPMIKCKMKVTDGPFQNRPVMTQFVLVVDNPNALSMFFRNMKNFGIDESFFAQMGSSGSLEPVAAALVGRRAQVTLGIRPWNGEDRNEVTNIKKYTGAPGTATGPSAPGMPSPLGTPGPIANTPAQVMAQAAANFNPATQLPNQQPPAPAQPLTVTPSQAPLIQTPQMPPQAAAQPQTPVAPPAVPQVVQAPVAPEPAPEWMPTPEETQAATPPQIPTAADTAPPIYAQPPITQGVNTPNTQYDEGNNQPPVTQYVDSNAQSVPAPPAPPI